MSQPRLQDFGLMLFQIFVSRKEIRAARRQAETGPIPHNILDRGDTPLARPILL
jgi:hypothetical protein